MSYTVNLAQSTSSLHMHKSYEIIIYVSGRGIFHGPEKDIETGPGKIVIIPPETLHHGTLIDEKYERIYIAGDFGQFFSISTPTVVFDNARGEGISLAKLIYSNRFADNEYLSALINAFAHFLMQNMKNENGVFLAVREIADKITEDFYNCGISLTEIIRNSGYSEDYIRAEFKKITGKTPTEFLTRIRISHACFLIDTCSGSLSLSEISEKCGFNDYIYFSRRFKAVMGVSPRKYASQSQAAGG